MLLALPRGGGSEASFSEGPMQVVQTAISLFFIFFSLFGKNAFADSTRLITVFCTEMVTLSGEGKQLGTTNEDWNAFAHRLAKREILKGADNVSEHYLNCIENFAAEFENAEFILGGRERLEFQSKKAEGFVEIARARSIIQNPYFQNLVVEAGSTVNYLPNTEAIQFRKERYNQLWTEFLSSLRDKLMSVVSDTYRVAVQ